MHTRVLSPSRRSSPIRKVASAIASFLMAVLFVAISAGLSHANELSSLNVNVDQARLIRLEKHSSEVIIGNPSIADVSVQSSLYRDHPWLEYWRHIRLICRLHRSTCSFLPSIALWKKEFALHCIAFSAPFLRLRGSHQPTIEPIVPPSLCNQWFIFEHKQRLFRPYFALENTPFKIARPLVIVIRSHIEFGVNDCVVI